MWSYTKSSKSSADQDTSSAPDQQSFNSLTADIILRSSDAVEFRVHTLILSEASTDFEKVFMLPQPPTYSLSEKPSAPASQPPTVSLPEDSAVLGTLLGVLYPGRGPRSSDVATLGQVLAAAEIQKYRMPGVIAQLESALVVLIAEEPMRVYALACRFGMEKAAALAAWETLRHPAPGPYFEEYEGMSGAAFYNLVQFRDKCSRLIEPLLENPQERIWEAECEVPQYSATRQVQHVDATCFTCYSRTAKLNVYLSRLKAAYLERIVGWADIVPSAAAIAATDFKACKECSQRISCEVLLELGDRLASILRTLVSDVEFVFRR